MNVTFRQLRLFLALAETGSVSAAARQMHITQPTASMQLKEVGRSVGVALYEPDGRRLRLTDAGRALAATAREMLQAWDTFEQEMDAVKGLSRGKLRIAVVSTAKYFMPHLIATFCRQHPHIDVALEIFNRDGVIQRLRENTDDLYIMSLPPSDMNLHDAVFLPNPIVVIAAADDPLCAREQLSLDELTSCRFILREKGSGTRTALERHLRKARFRPDVRLELGSNEAIKASVAAGLGLGVVSEHALRGHRQEAGVCVLPVQDFPIPSAWHVVHPAARRLSPAALAFKQHMLQQVDAAPVPSAQR